MRIFSPGRGAGEEDEGQSTTKVHDGAHARMMHRQEGPMERVIATLLKDFEDGKMDRRQLIRSLAMVAVAGPAVASAQAPAPKAPWKTVTLDHISYAVSDYKRSAAFYAGLMGWEIANDNGKNQATLKIGDIGEVIIRNARRPEGSPAPAAAPPNGDRPPVTGVINHISWGVSPWDTEGVKAELEKRGLKPRPDMVGENFKSWHVLDPDGWDLQISNQTK
jgi:catechol 2,3-dioxygenase-like lactoylglutathione lyase family enzyme